MKWESLDMCIQAMKQTTQSNLSAVYEFGTYECITLAYLEKKCLEENIPVSRFVGFDSFQGFPSFQTEYAIDPNTYRAWEGMDFRCVGSLDELDSKLALFKKKFVNEPLLIPGYYEDSLKDELVETHGFKPALLVHIDCDLYTSTKTVLDFLCKHTLIQEGTLIKYDEWGPLFKPGEPFGEERAHLEMIQTYGLEFQTLGTIGDKILFRCTKGPTA